MAFSDNDNGTGIEASKNASTRSLARPTAVLFVVVAAVWVVLDRLTKMYFEGSYTLGQASAQSYPLFHFRLVHNTGMAWGMFGDSTFALGILSCIVCAAILAAFLLWHRLTGHALTVLETLGLAFVFAGGLGNAFDRFFQGYVVDFIEFTFIDFPVFNVADIGVTCGFVLVVIGYLLASRNDDYSVVAEGHDVSDSVYSDSSDAADHGASVESRNVTVSKSVSTDGHGAASGSPCHEKETLKGECFEQEVRRG